MMSLMLLLLLLLMMMFIRSRSCHVTNSNSVSHISGQQLLITCSGNNTISHPSCCCSYC
jgi:hypothetical protein